MSRRIVLQTGIDDAEILMESLADNESQLQELVKDNPDLMPVEDLGLTGPLLVIGKETALPAGSADLIALSQEGSLILVEFKTGPNNSDFRAAIAQLLDYGAGLWAWTGIPSSVRFLCGISRATTVLTRNCPASTAAEGCSDTSLERFK